MITKQALIPEASSATDKNQAINKEKLLSAGLAALLASPLLASPRRMIAKQAELEHSIAIGEPV